jgi:hypothetical protein
MIPTCQHSVSPLFHHARPVKTHHSLVTSHKIHTFYAKNTTADASLLGFKIPKVFGKTLGN